MRISARRQEIENMHHSKTHFGPQSVFRVPVLEVSARFWGYERCDVVLCACEVCVYDVVWECAVVWCDVCVAAAPDRLHT